MTKPEKHSRRDFLQGRAAARALAGKAQDLIEAATARMELATPLASSLHLHASRRAMACEFAVQYHASQGEVTEEIMAAFDLVETLEEQMTVYRDQSEVIDINHGAANSPVSVEPHLFSLLELAGKLHRETGGAFDITSSPLSRAWGFLRREGRLPSEEEIAEAMRWVGFDDVKLDAAELSIRFGKPGLEINLNSLGKGYALDRVAAFLDERGVTDYLWHGGSSSVLARGCNQADPKQAWTLGLRDPLKPKRRLAEFYLRDRALGTAGGATQFFEHEGKLYSHILDPRTGWPAEGVFTSTVIAPTAAEADGLATAFYVMG
ncbi:MAG: FAD:protein FMN transferase, partial [Planctomycetes bacterium]|nr:FAD:protein FMN transferase [Planctomycetota bacterium]